MTVLPLATVRPAAHALATPGLPPRFDQGVVVAIVGTTVTLLVAGSTTATPLVPYISSYYPVVGDSVIVGYFGDSPFVLGGLTIHAGWLSQDWSAAWGIVAEDEQLVSQGPFTAETTLVTGTTVTLLGNRLYRIMGKVRTWTSTVALDAAGLRIKDSATIIDETVADASQGGLGAGIPIVEAIMTTNAAGRTDARVISTGSHTFFLKAIRLAGTGNLNFDATYPMILSVEDLGPDGTPP